MLLGAYTLPVAEKVFTENRPSGGVSCVLHDSAWYSGIDLQACALVRHSLWTKEYLIRRTSHITLQIV